MAKKLIAKKGYTVEVTSWENDGDNYNTKSITYKTKEEAVCIMKMCKRLFISCNNGYGGIGNWNEDDETKNEIILAYLKKNLNVIKLFAKKGADLTDNDMLCEIVMNINGDLMGSSEYYDSRVFESGAVFYSPEDVYLEKIVVR